MRAPGCGGNAGLLIGVGGAGEKAGSVGSPRARAARWHVPC
ncbi:hypothetical protein I547_5788 [Mycobacterium kansasii 824]|nr:hypothetical protein I547_5788 [Mycobacterium kansasii 824]